MSHDLRVSSLAKECIGCSGGRPKGTGASDGYSVGYSGGAVLDIGQSASEVTP